MSNVIKAENVTLVQPGFITLHIPIIDTGHTAEQKIIKMLEELDELLNEFCTGEVKKPRAMAEMFDVVQVMVGYILASSKEYLVEEDLGKYVQEYFDYRNREHNAKMRRYTAERGWAVVGG